MGCVFGWLDSLGFVEEPVKPGESTKHNNESGEFSPIATDRSYEPHRSPADLRSSSTSGVNLSLGRGS